MRRKDPQAPHDSDPRVLARRLLELLENSRPLPVLRHQLRVKKPQVNELVAAIRHANDPQERGSLSAVLKAAEAVEEAAYRAMPVPLTDDVRLPREKVDDLVRGLRAAGA